GNDGPEQFIDVEMDIDSFGEADRRQAAQHIEAEIRRRAERHDLVHAAGDVPGPAEAAGRVGGHEAEAGREGVDNDDVDIEVPGDRQHAKGPGHEIEAVIVVDVARRAEVGEMPFHLDGDIGDVLEN